MKTALSVNVNKVALVRNTRHLGIPSVTRAATLCLQAGAHGITVHPRPTSATSARRTCSTWPTC
jgi:pyridoxine 5-phosphate synthase